MTRFSDKAMSVRFLSDDILVNNVSENVKISGEICFVGKVVIMEIL